MSRVIPADESEEGETNDKTGTGLMKGSITWKNQE
jgi:hypothetical protein